MKSNFSLNPLEGTPVLSFSLIGAAIFLILALLIDGILRIAFLLLLSPFLLMIISTLYLRFSHKWGHIHYPLMIRYSRMMGMASVLHKDKSIEDQVDEGVVLLLQSLYNISHEEAKKYFADFISKTDVFHDKNTMIKMFDKKILNKSHEENLDKVNKIMSMYKEGSVRGMRVSSLIAELVKTKYGESEMFEYMYAVLLDKAK